MNEINTLDPFDKEHAILSNLPIFQSKYTNFFGRSLEGRNVKYLQTSPLALFKEKISNFGAHFFGFGKSLVKGANLAFRTFVQEEVAFNELNFKINHVFRASLQQTLDEIVSMDRHVVNALLDRSESHSTSIRVEKDQPFPVGNSFVGFSTKITFSGLGTIFICTSSEYPSIYNRIVVQMESDKTIEDFHAVLAFLNLEKSFYESTIEDQKRHKIGHLFRTFYPREAYELERSSTFFNLTPDQIKAKIIDDVPHMANIFDTYLDELTLEEILPGRMRYKMKGLAHCAYNLGARGLTTAITGAYGNELYQRVASILQSGILSSETRKFLGLSVSGLSTDSDYYSGGSDVVYTQMITQDNCKKETDFSGLYYLSDIRLLISLDAIETGTYQYYIDSYGNRSTVNYYGTLYSQRPGILEFILNLQSSTLCSSRREQTLWSEDPPYLEEEWKRFEHKILKSLQDGQGFLKELGIVEVDEAGRIKVLGKPLCEFLELLKYWLYLMGHLQIVFGGHEVMIKERIAPKYIQKILVANQETRDRLISHLHESHLIQDGFILGHPVDEFILVTNKASETLFM